MNDRSHGGLSLVRTAKRRIVQQNDFVQQSLQGTLFPTLKRNLAIVVYFPDVTEEEFKTALECAKPRFVVDFRAVPTFALGRLNRRSVFDVLEKSSAVYLEMALDQAHLPTMHLDTMMKSLSDIWRSQRGPVMFLVHRGDQTADRLSFVMSSLIEQSHVAWELYDIPHFA